ncbi:MAG: ferric reductase-like transmembrane domain-containing protein [Acidimicrobiales bacterium]
MTIIDTPTATPANAADDAPAKSLAATVLGRRSDWLRTPRLSRPRPGLHWVGPLVVAATTFGPWSAFSGAIGEGGGSVGFGLYIGAVSIVLMAWSFVLALRVRWMERFFGGLDSMYRVHRWAGALAAGAMFLHTRNEPEIENGIAGASESMADAAEGLAGTGEVMLYLLVLLSVLRWMPYRWWRWSHKLLGIPFVFACWHFFTADKTYANSSGWGLYFGSIMALGIGAFVARVLVRDPLLKGARYRVSEAVTRGDTIELLLDPVGRPVEHRAGQFASLKVQRRGLSEPHLFTIASRSDDGSLRFFIKDLGDWTNKIVELGEDLVGAEVRVEGPYGRFEPLPTSGSDTTVWVAGGAGVTPFLAAIDELEPAPAGQRPTLFYAVRGEDDAIAIDVVRAAAADGRIDLVVCDSSSGGRFDPAMVHDRFTAAELDGSHLAVCGPAGLVAAVQRLGDVVGARSVEQEDFDIRQGFGPDLPPGTLTAVVDAAADRVRRRRAAPRASSRPG